MLENRDVGRAIAIDAHHVGLHLMGVGDGRHVTEKDRCAVDHLNRQPVELCHLVGTAVELDAIFAIADLDRARRDDGVGVGQCRRDVLRGKPVGIKLRRVEVDHDRSRASAERRWRRQPLDAEQPHANEVEAVIEELLLRERVAEDVELCHRHVSGVVVNDVRRDHPGRKNRQQRLRHRPNLRDSRRGGRPSDGNTRARSRRPRSTPTPCARYR